MPVRIRPGGEEDAEALLAIYRPYVEDTAVSFETAAPTIAEFAARIRKARDKWQWLVADDEGECAGYAYGSLHRERAAYCWSVEVSAYVAPRYQRQGIARALYLQLFKDLAARGYCNAFAGVTLPNSASLGMHRALGFTDIGVFKSVGRKFGQWHDVAWLQRTLRDAPPRE